MIQRAWWPDAQRPHGVGPLCGEHRQCWWIADVVDYRGRTYPRLNLQDLDSHVFQHSMALHSIYRHFWREVIWYMELEAGITDQRYSWMGGSPCADELKAMYDTLREVGEATIQ